MAGFAPVAWVENSLAVDEYRPDTDQQSMVSIVEDLLKCRESFENKSASYRKLRRYIRRGISPVLRPNTWKTLSGGDKVLESTPSLFDDIQDDLEYALFTGSTTFFNASNVNKYYLTDDGWKKAQEVLAVLSQLHCDVTFCPIVQPLVCLFMHFMDKEDCFACMDSLFTSKKHGLDKNVTDYGITAKTFQDALKKWKKPAYTWFKASLKDKSKNSKQISIFFLHWLQWIFNALDFWTMVHIIDQFLLDGQKVFYRIGLVLFDDVYKSYKVKGAIDKEQLERIFCEVASATQKSELLNRAFNITGVSRLVISELRQNNLKLLRINVLMIPEIEQEHIFRGPVEGSDLLTSSQVSELFAILPRRFRHLCKLTCIFTTEVHGTSLKTLYHMCEQEPCTILLVKTIDKEIFGAFLSGALQDRFEHRKDFYGNGETFLFRFTPNFKRYTWRGLRSKDWHGIPSFFQFADEERIVVGGGDGWGLSIEEDLSQGLTQRCTTFDNDPLASKEGKFECLRVEVWALEEMGHLPNCRDSDKIELQKIEVILDNNE